MIFTPNSFGSRRLREYNKCHLPAGSSKGGQFAPTGVGNCSPDRAVYAAADFNADTEFLPADTEVNDQRSVARFDHIMADLRQWDAVRGMHRASTESELKDRAARAIGKRLAAELSEAQVKEFLDWYSASAAGRYSTPNHPLRPDPAKAEEQRQLLLQYSEQRLEALYQRAKTMTQQEFNDLSDEEFRATGLAPQWVMYARQSGFDRWVERTHGFQLRNLRAAHDGPEAFYLMAGGFPPGAVDGYAKAHAEWAAYREAVASKSYDTHENRAADVADMLIGNWARTSHDADSTAIALQRSVQRLFLPDRQVFDRVNLDPVQNSLMADVRVEEEKFSHVFDAFVRSAYAETQDLLRQAGIGPESYVTLYRGMKFEGRSGRELPKTPEVVDVLLQPASSFSFSTREAEAFAGAGSSGRVLVARVKAKDILGMPGSGWGCYNEMEAVVLGGRRPVVVTPRTYELSYAVSLARRRLGVPRRGDPLPGERL